MINRVMLDGLLQLCNTKLDFFADSLQVFEKAAKENPHVDYRIELQKYGYAKSQVSDIKILIEKFLNDKRSVDEGEKSFLCLMKEMCKEQCQMCYEEQHKTPPY